MNIRIIPVLCLLDDALVKTTKFSNPQYIGDPQNTVRIFNELEVDELCFLNIRATRKGQEPDYHLLETIATECFMPLSYGGGINSLSVAKKVFRCGIEKVVLSTAAWNNPRLVTECAEQYGSQAVVVAIDVKKNLFGKYSVHTCSGTINTGKHPVEWAEEVAAAGAGEIFLTSINNEGTWTGFDNELIKEVSAAVSIPVIAHGGAGNIQHLADAIQCGASAVAAGNLFLYQKKGLGVLINYPTKEIAEALNAA